MSGDAATRPDIPAATKDCGCGPVEPCKAHMDPEPSRVQEDAATARTLLSGALVEELARRVGEYENAITWNTSCLSCSRTLDSSIAERERAERAEVQLAAIKALCGEGTPAVATDRIEAILRDEERGGAAAEMAALKAALRRHMPTLDEHGTPVCAGCLEPAPCPDAGLIGESP